MMRLYALAMMSYPRRARQRFANEMLLMLEDTWRQERFKGTMPATLFWLRAFRDVATNSFALRFAAHDIRERTGRLNALVNYTRPSGRSPAARIEIFMGNILQDFRFAARMIRRSPGFSAAVVLTLTLGIGANAAIFSVLDGVVLSPLPYPAADRLVHVWTQYPEQDIDRFEVSQLEFNDYRLESELFEAMFAYRMANVVVTGVGRPMRADIAVASAEIWDVFGGQPHIGAAFGVEQDRPGHDQVLVLDHGYWQQTFGGDPGIVGRTISINGFPFEVIGVIDENFSLPEADADMYTPLAIDTANLTNRRGHNLWVVGRTKPDVDLRDVLAEMRVVSDRWMAEYDHAHPFTANRLSEHVIGDARGPLFVLAAAVGLVLLIACANVAGLVMARTTARQREIGVRAALGAQRSRLVCQILTEGVLLSTAGGLLGLMLAGWGTRLLLRLEPGNLPRLDEIGTDATLLGFVLLLSLVTGLGFAALPAWRAARVDAGIALATMRTTAGASRQRFQRLMVVAEVAVAIVLVIGAGLLIRSFSELTRVDPGIKPDNMITTRVALPSGNYPDAASVDVFWTRLRSELAAVPGFRDTTLVRSLPMRDEVFMERFLREGETEESVAASGHTPSFDWQVSFPGYFRAAGIPLSAGRDFTEADRSGSPRVAIVSDSLVRRYFAGLDPIGKQIRIVASNPRDVPFEIIGVAGDVHHNGLGAAPPIHIYTPFLQAQDYRNGLQWTAAVIVRTDLDLETGAHALREAVWSIDPELALMEVTTMGSLLRNSVARPRFTTLLLSLFSALALVLACVGVYGMVAYSVAQRTREMGIRIALGAQNGEIIRLVLREGLVPALLGIGIGIFGALFLTRIMSSLLFGIASTDVTTYVLVTGVLGCAAFTAAWVPARRAVRVDPLESLRAE